jgi:hypothetical protein
LARGAELTARHSDMRKSLETFDGGTWNNGNCSDCLQARTTFRGLK